MRIYYRIIICYNNYYIKVKGVVILKRIDKIYNYIFENSQKITKNDLNTNVGFTSSEISEKLNILRNNVSMELNELLRQGKIIKIKVRPVLYLDRATMETIINRKLSNDSLEFRDISEITGTNALNITNPFNDLIGFETSLRYQVEQAKAALLYPPNGLHTLIIGQTGVGKTLFAKMMFNYAKYSKRLTETAPFVTFNCADYYNNPQLLISHIFGHTKGSFTGADIEKDGIVQKANGGILFLDEIHRLPPEGQEMLFYFMDTGTFNKLGDTERFRKSNMLIICATTEDPSSALLKTFVRRIPIVINIPSFDKRSAKDKLDIIKFLLSNEAHRVNKKIKIEPDAVKALIGSTSYGNIGQMKSNIQLVCAKGFLNSLNDKDEIKIDFKNLPTEIKNGLFYLSGKRKELEEISLYLDCPLIITPEGHKILSDEDAYEMPFNLYKLIENKTAILKDGGADEEYINKFISTDINIHIKSFYDKFKNDDQDRNNLLKIVNPDIIEFVEEIKLMVQNTLNKNLNERFIYALSLHLSSFLNRVENKKELKYSGNISSIIEEKRFEFNIALEIKDRLEKKYNIAVPEIEVTYLTLLLSSIQYEQNNEHVAIIVAAHGNNTANSMVSVAKQLLGECVIAAIDMPLDISPTETLEEISLKAKELDMGKGVLLLVDMGSLANFDTIITEKTDIKVKTIDMVSTPLVLEAIRKANILDMELEDIYTSLKDFRGYTHKEENNYTVSDKINAIVTICSTGEGTAEKLKELAQKIILSLTEEEILVIPIGLKDINERLNSISNNYNILLTIGITNPKINKPHISLESLISGNGEKILSNIIKNNYAHIEEKNESIVVKKLCEDSLNQFLTYLNPNKIISVLLNFTNVLENDLNKKFSNSIRIRLIIHVGCALERMIVNDGLIYKDKKDNLNPFYINCIKSAAKTFKTSLNINLSEDEICFISEML